MMVFLRKEATLSTWLKIDLSKVKSFPGILVTIDAALGALYMRESSPNVSPV